VRYWFTLGTSRKDSKKGLPALPRSRAPVASSRTGKHAPQVSVPEIKVKYTAAGRDTLAAIAEELAGGESSSEPSSISPETLESPDGLGRGARRSGGPGGAVSRPGPRSRTSTVSYGDRVSNAPGAIAPPRRAEKVALPAPEVTISESPDNPVLDLDASSAGESVTRVRTRQRTLDFKDRPRTRDTSPEVITIEERPVGRETLAAIAEELARENRSALQSDPDEASDSRSAQPVSVPRPRSTPPRPSESDCEIMEMVTFVVRGGELARLSSEAARREFVAERLMHRLPVDSLEGVDRIDVTPWTVQGTIILRVWCRVLP